MKNEALTKWRLLLRRPVTGLDIEKIYDELIREADMMLRNRIIDDSEWRGLIRSAGGLLVKSAEKHGL